MKAENAEKIIESLGADVYPITLVKYLMNRRRCLTYFEKAADPSFEIRGPKYTVDHSECTQCKDKEDLGILCRQHTSIDRVLNASAVLKDTETNVYLFKNEIFKMVGNRLVIIYCPHPKLITGDVNDKKVRKINPITIEDAALTALPSYAKVGEFSSLLLLDKSIKCWFNDAFSLITIPEDRNGCGWALTSNT